MGAKATHGSCLSTQLDATPTRTTQPIVKPSALVISASGEVSIAPTKIPSHSYRTDKAEVREAEA